MASEEDVAVEVEAVQAVYGDDCAVLDTYPPHLHVHIKPRTADVTSEQFVEALIGVRASSKYPEEPPSVDIIDSKGLDGQRQKCLLTCIQDKASELSSCLMLVALCEEAVEKLSSMNHPDGDCPLCLSPLVPENEHDKALPFMKLMSCFHCFHCECIIRWWNWLQNEKQYNAKYSSGATVSVRAMENETDTQAEMEGNVGNCPICRKVFHAKDLKHVLDLVGVDSSRPSLDDTKSEEEETILISDSENLRRLKFDGILKLQEENGGLIEPKRSLAIVPGMYLPQPTAATTVSGNDQTDRHQEDSTSEFHSSCSSTVPNNGRRRNAATRRHRARHTNQPVKQWIRKEHGATG